MSTVVVVGCQYGDEGKGKIVDYLAPNANMVVRFGGGNNAGHTVVVGKEEYKLHLIPSGILYKNIDCVLGNGVVINLLEMIQEINRLKERGISTDSLFISDRAHVILPTHIIRDNASEEKRKDKIGTTGRGIGPTYMDKIGRVGIRVGDLAQTTYSIGLMIGKNWDLTGIHYQSAEATALAADLKEYYDILKKHIINTSDYINLAIRSKKNILFEGAQGLLIDVDHGTYPYVTSSNPSAGGVCTGSGVGPSKIDHVVGVIKAYTTRVGEGPFPTELHGLQADDIRDRGNEFGTTTGRPRRCGWLDMVALRHAINVNGVDSLAITKLDILDGLTEIKICRAYEVNGRVSDVFPSAPGDLYQVRPIYETFPGWTENSSNVSKWSLLPQAAKDYIDHIRTVLKVPIKIIGNGAERDKIIGSGKEIWDETRK